LNKILYWLELLERSSVRLCPYCRTRLEQGRRDFEWQDYVVDEAIVADCHNCGYWVYSSYSQVDETEFGDPIHTWGAHISKLNEFSEELPQECHAELAQYLRRNPTFWHMMEPSPLERLVAEVYRRNYAPCEAIHVGRPGDGGVDVLLIDSGAEKWLVQVKRRETDEASEGVATIRNLLGAMILEGMFRGIVVSTADHFTFQACRARERAARVGFYLELVDRGKLNRMLDPLLPDRPWLQFLSKDFTDWTRYFSEAIPSRRQRRLF
jgi:restriction endonuclease Mrr